ncbi:hypothetical protein ABZ920_13395 [Streptomyces sp. NPDC046831]|uniref:Rv1733c family protein n=1 Tax=Streptomyces sp. NPDC046831 TaxID=3154805 RepID=UPI0033FDF4CB
MRGRNRNRRSLWRWRHNPLRRREDLVEGWVLLSAWLVVAVGGPFTGVVTAQATVDSLAQQRADRHPATATVAGDAVRPDTGRVGAGSDRVFATVRWTAPDGSRHSDQTLVDAGARAGDRITVWTDGGNRVSPPPLTPVQALTQAAVTGASASLAVTGAAAGGFYAVRVVLDRRRARAWDAEWEEVGPQWGRTAH